MYMNKEHQGLFNYFKYNEASNYMCYSTVLILKDFTHAYKCYPLLLPFSLYSPHPSSPHSIGRYAIVFVFTLEVFCLR